MSDADKISKAIFDLVNATSIPFDEIAEKLAVWTETWRSIMAKLGEVWLVPSGEVFNSAIHARYEDVILAMMAQREHPAESARIVRQDVNGLVEAIAYYAPATGWTFEDWVFDAIKGDGNG